MSMFQVFFYHEVNTVFEKKFPRQQWSFIQITQTNQVADKIMSDSSLLVLCSAFVTRSAIDDFLGMIAGDTVT